MLGYDINPAVANMYARETGHEIAGTPIASFISRQELSDHIAMMHPGERFPERSQRALGRISINVNAQAPTKKTRKRRTKPKVKDIEEMTQTEVNTEYPETADEGFMTEGATEKEQGSGFTDDDGQVFDGDGGLL